ncbi:MAG: ABC transporter substrate-binding protein [Clostridia bacterium]
MKNIKNKITIVVVLAMVAIFACIGLTSCENNDKTITIIKFGNHPSLNNCYDGILLGLKEGGIDLEEYTVDLQDSNFDSSVSASQAANAVNKKVGMVGAIATPSAMAAASAAKGKIPVVYCAVSDPVAAGLTGEDAQNVCGSSDILDFEGQIDLIKAFIPDVDSIGVLYCTAEANSISQLATLKTVAATYDIEIKEVSVTNANEIPTATDTLLAKDIDCITNLTDNTIVGALDVIIEKTNAKNIPVFGSEIEQVKKGCLASASLDYVELGRATGRMMADIILGKTTADGNFIKIKDSFKCYNSVVATALEITVPDIIMTDVEAK